MLVSIRRKRGLWNRGQAEKTVATNKRDTPAKRLPKSPRQKRAALHDMPWNKLRAKAKAAGISLYRASRADLVQALS